MPLPSFPYSPLHPPCLPLKSLASEAKRRSKNIPKKMKKKRKNILMLRGNTSLVCCPVTVWSVIDMTSCFHQMSTEMGLLIWSYHSTGQLCVSEMWHPPGTSPGSSLSHAGQSQGTLATQIWTENVCPWLQPLLPGLQLQLRTLPSKAMVLKLEGVLMRITYWNGYNADLTEFDPESLI